MEIEKCLATLEDHSHSSVYSLSFTLDGELAIASSADGIVKIWEVQTSKCIATLQGHTGTVHSTSLSGDGKYLASCSWDKTVRIWVNINDIWY